MFAPHGNHIAPNADCTIFAYISKKIRRDETEQNKNRNIFIINNIKPYNHENEKIKKTVPHKSICEKYTIVQVVFVLFKLFDIFESFA